MKAAVLVTGAGGMIGRRLVSALAAHGHTVIAASRNPLRLPKQVLNPVGDLANSSHRSSAFQMLTQVEAGERIVVHLAALNLFGESPREFARAVRCNVGLTEAMLESAARTTCNRLLLASTGLVYGTRTSRPHAETSTTAPSCSFYACTKLAAEQLVRGWASASRLQGEIVRFSNVFGPDSSDVTVAGRIFAQIRRKHTVQVDYGFPVRDFLYVDDAVEALRRLIETPVRTPLSITNVATGIGTSIDDLVATAVTLAGVPRAPARISVEGEKSCLVLSNRRLLSRVGWVPSVDLAHHVAHCIPRKRLRG